VDDVRAAGVIRESVSELLVSVRNTINYFVNTHPETPVSGIVVAGGAAALPGLLPSLSEYAGLPVTTGEPLQGAQRSRSITDEQVSERSSAVAVAYGLAVGSAA
jgi:type IV pilus assembly protein PilM